MTPPDLPAATLAICIDAGRRNAGELLRTLSKLDGAADCALLVHACETEDETIAQAHHLTLAAFPGPNAVHLARSWPDRTAAREWLIAQAPADWILFLSPDNLPAAPDFLTQYLAAARAAEGPGAILGGLSADSSLYAGQGPSGTGIDAAAPADVRAADPGLFVSSANLLVHRDILMSIPFDDGFTSDAQADLDWGIRVHAAYPIRHIDNPVIRSKSGADERYFDAAESYGPGLARLLRRHPDIAGRLPLVASARRVKGIPLLSPAARLIASSQVLPGKLRASAFWLYCAAACSPYIEPA
jgi:hypothetical protein